MDNSWYYKIHKNRDKLYKTLTMTHHESYTILKVKLKAFNTLLKKTIRAAKCRGTMSLLLVEIRPILGTHGKP